MNKKEIKYEILETIPGHYTINFENTNFYDVNAVEVMIIRQLEKQLEQSEQKRLKYLRIIKDNICDDMIFTKIDKLLEIDKDLKDILISAYRYSLTRHTYITGLTCDYIMKHTKLIDERVKNILLKDTYDYLMQQGTDKLIITNIDYETFYNFYQWLNEFEIGND